MLRGEFWQRNAIERMSGLLKESRRISGL